MLLGSGGGSSRDHINMDLDEDTPFVDPSAPDWNQFRDNDEEVILFIYLFIYQSARTLKYLIFNSYRKLFSTCDVSTTMIVFASLPNFIPLFALLVF